ncbi:uncharacterized protein L3040_001457 [Drepanopeziza brunnea f. sp. 'multigermtubi']|uniref:uncharacterized protein n=1 Tax=Drepanopeziza brunnea f. sp. 'multigermtubi' TaxID=698441 RepID=UPI002398D584|nr:hypothetical protein L3040_001457 [Drepanopeziza brunnea f. sp. 'multigermtubi']
MANVSILLSAAILIFKLSLGRFPLGLRLLPAFAASRLPQPRRRISAPLYPAQVFTINHLSQIFLLPPLSLHGAE